MLKIIIEVQPDDETCGPTSLHAIYTYYGLDIPLNDLIPTVQRSLSGGTLSPMLGVHALDHGFKTKIYIYNLKVFDPTWFQKKPSKQFLIDKLEAQKKVKHDESMRVETNAYIDYLRKDGEICFKCLNSKLLKKYLRQGIPILTALSSTYLYRSARERFTPDGKSIYDDIKGEPCGHFVILYGYDEETKEVFIADPYPMNPLFKDHYYKVGVTRVINSIMLSVLTYDANLLIIEPIEK